MLDDVLKVVFSLGYSCASGWTGWSLHVERWSQLQDRGEAYGRGMGITHTRKVSTCTKVSCSKEPGVHVAGLTLKHILKTWENCRWTCFRIMCAGAPVPKDSSFLIWLARGLRKSEKWLTCFTCVQNFALGPFIPMYTTVHPTVLPGVQGALSCLVVQQLRQKLFRNGLTTFHSLKSCLAALVPPVDLSTITN